MLAVAACACRGTGGDAEKPKPGVLECRVPLHDFGKPRQGQRLVHTFQLINSGGRTLEVLGVERSFSCRIQSFPRSIAPGAIGALEVVCDNPKLHGKMSDDLLVRSNAKDGAELKLTLKADIEPALAFEAASARFELGFGEQRSQELSLMGYRAREATLRLVAADDIAPRVELLAATHPRAPGVRLTATARRVEHRVSSLRFHTGLDHPAEISLTYVIDVRSNLTVDPTNPYFNLREPPPRERVITVASRRPDFVVHDARISEGPFEAAVTHDEATRTYSVRVRFVDERLPAVERGAVGKLILATNDPAEPLKEVPLFALGRRPGSTSP